MLRNKGEKKLLITTRLKLWAKALVPGDNDNPGINAGISEKQEDMCFSPSLKILTGILKILSKHKI